MAGSGCSASGRKKSNDCPVACGGAARDCAEVGEESITVDGGWFGPDVTKTPVVVAMVGMDALPMRNDDLLDCVDVYLAWDSGYQREIIDGMTVYYGDDLCETD